MCRNIRYTFILGYTTTSIGWDPCSQKFWWLTYLLILFGGHIWFSLFFFHRVHSCINFLKGIVFINCNNDFWFTVIFVELFGWPTYCFAFFKNACCFAFLSASRCLFLLLIICATVLCAGSSSFSTWSDSQIGTAG